MLIPLKWLARYEREKMTLTQILDQIKRLEVELQDLRNEVKNGPTWTRASGEVIPISTMSTTHIQNAIRKLERNGLHKEVVIPKHASYDALVSELKKRDDLPRFTWATGWSDI